MDCVERRLEQCGWFCFSVVMCCSVGGAICIYCVLLLIYDNFGRLKKIFSVSIRAELCPCVCWKILRRGMFVEGD